MKIVKLKVVELGNGSKIIGTDGIRWFIKLSDNQGSGLVIYNTSEMEEVYSLTESDLRTAFDTLNN